MTTTLDQILTNKSVRVVDIAGGWGLRRHVSQLGIHPGDILTVIRHAAMGGPILIMIHGSQIAIGRGMASHITVEDAE
ncbi:MAG: ferrous iron transport protein A [Syntrophobacterales bacterium]|nr:MAG: ferrous iron transport protein A [Syntrophobacterales bacterium]